MKWLRLAAPALFALAVAASDESPRERGRSVYEDTQDLAYPSCAHCHALVSEEEERKLPHVGPGATLYGSARRAGWRNLKTYAGIGEALQLCAKQWQKRKKGIEGEDLAALVAYLEAHGGDAALPMRKVEKQPKLAEDWSGGDAGRGKALTERFCGGCHHDGEDALSARLRPHSKQVDAVARKVRGYDAKGKFHPQEGSMSYYTTERLPDDDLRHILAYLGK